MGRALVQLSFAATTDAGLVRANNEDCYVADRDLAFFVVADGMGGHASGEIASSAVAEDVILGRIDVFGPGETGPSA